MTDKATQPSGSAELSAFLTPLLAEAKEACPESLVYRIDTGIDWPKDGALPAGPMYAVSDTVLHMVPPAELEQIQQYARELAKEMMASESGQSHEGVASSGEEGASPAKPFTMTPVDHTEMRPDRPRGGFTLIELITSLTIVGVLSALALSGVMAARDAAGEMGYKNNMRQASLAIQHYRTDNNGKFPYAVTFDSVPNAKTQSATLLAHSWVVDVLPYLEQQPLSNQYDKTKPYNQQLPEVQNATIATLNHPRQPLEPGRMDMAAMSSSAYSATDPNVLASSSWTYTDGVQAVQPGTNTVAMPNQYTLSNGTLPIGNKNQWVSNGQVAILPNGEPSTVIIAGHVNSDKDGRDPWLQDLNAAGTTHVTGLMFGWEPGMSHTAGGLLGNVYEQGNFVTNHFAPNDGSAHPNYNTVVYADGHVGRIRPTGPTGASFGTPEAQKWADKVNSSSGSIDTSMIIE